MVMKKREKLSETDALSDDRLSSLSDPLIFHILSFLPTKQVVATTILAKRWKKLWTFVGNVILDNVGNRKMIFFQIVYRLLLQQKAQCLKRMCLRFFSISFNGNHGFNENDISNWVTTAIDRSIEDLDLNFYFKFSPPACLFNSQTLVKLNMDYCVITSMSVLHAPCLPSLKELQLRDLKFSTEFLKLLILGCPALERLSLSVARDNDVVSCDISSSTLKWLELECKESPDNILTQKVVLRVPALEFIRIHYPSCEIDVEDKFSNLVEADVHLFHVYKRDDSFHDSFPRIIKLLSNVRILRLNTDSKRPMTMALQAEFPNLTELEISSTSFEFTLLQSFMDHSVNLEIISFEKRYMRHNEHLQVSWNEPQHVPKCFMSSLKKIVIKGYTNETELDMVKYFLRNGEILEKIEIHCSEDEDDYNSKYYMIQKILVLSRTSPRCEVSFS